jgi:hypothetical protein
MGQTLDQEDLVEVVSLAYKQNKLPGELGYRLDSADRRIIRDQFIVIKSTEELGVIRQYDVGPHKVMIWDTEDIFVFDPPCWMILSETVRKGNMVVIKYETTTGSRPSEIIPECHRGKIKAKTNGHNWTIISSKFVANDCQPKGGRGKK